MNWRCFPGSAILTSFQGSNRRHVPKLSIPVICMVLATSLLGCTSIFPIPENPTTSAYPNLPKPNEDLAMEEERGSSAYLASYEVPWFVNLKELAAQPGPYRGRAGIQKWRRMFYERARQSAAHPEVGTASDDRFIGLALSGGGMRSAVFSTQILFELQKLGILDQVDVVSALSGGAIAATLFARSEDGTIVSSGSDDTSAESVCPEAFEDTTSVVWDPECQ